MKVSKRSWHYRYLTWLDEEDEDYYRAMRRGTYLVDVIVSCLLAPSIVIYTALEVVGRGMLRFKRVYEWIQDGHVEIVE
jgi:hypothetical protein